LLGQGGERRQEFLASLDLDCLAQSASTATPRQFDPIAHLLGQLGRRRDEFLAALDLDRLAQSASTATPPQYAAVARLRSELGSSGEALLGRFNAAGVASSISSAGSQQLEGIVEFLSVCSEALKDAIIDGLNFELLVQGFESERSINLSALRRFASAMQSRQVELLEALGRRPTLVREMFRVNDPAEFSEVSLFLNEIRSNAPNLLEEIDYEYLGIVTNRCSGQNIEGLTYFASSLTAELRAKFLPLVNWSRLLELLPLDEAGLRVVAHCLHYASMAAKPGSPEIDRLAKWISENESQLRAMITGAQRGAQFDPTRPAPYAFMALLLQGISTIAPEVARSLAVSTRRSLRPSMGGDPSSPQLQQLLEVLKGLSPETSSVPITRRRNRKSLGWKPDKP
jgi:hypothetical protein